MLWHSNNKSFRGFFSSKTQSFITEYTANNSPSHTLKKTKIKKTRVCLTYSKLLHVTFRLLNLDYYNWQLLNCQFAKPILPPPDVIFIYHHHFLYSVGFYPDFSSIICGYHFHSYNNNKLEKYYAQFHTTSSCSFFILKLWDWEEKESIDGYKSTTTAS